MSFFDLFRKKKATPVETGQPAPAVNKQNEARRALCEEMANVAALLGQHSLLSARRAMNALLDSGIGTQEMSAEQIEEIIVCLADIKAHCSEPYSDLIARKIDRIRGIVNGTTNNSAADRELERTDDKIIELGAQLKDIDAKLTVIEQNQEAVLGSDKNKWEALNADRKRLLSRKLVLENNYRSLLAQKQNLGIVSDLDTAKEISDFIGNQNAAIDMSTVQLNATVNRETAEAVTETGSALSSLLEDNFVQVSADYEYERALEAKQAARMREAEDKSPSPTENA